MTLATGLALGGMRPVVALYSTFLQRAFDQTVHDVCQNDAAGGHRGRPGGLVGEDGTSHQGMFTLPAQRQLPHLVIASPQGRAGASLAAAHRARPGPPVRPALPARSRASGCRRVEPAALPSGEARSCARAGTCCSSASARSSMRAVEAADRLEADGWSVGVINARFAKPLDRQLILDAGPRQAAGGHVRGERRDRRLRVRRARGLRGGPARRPRLSRRRRSGSSASRATDSWTTVRSPISGGCIRLDVPGLTAQVHEAIEQLRIAPAGTDDAQAPDAELRRTR